MFTKCQDQCLTNKCYVFIKYIKIALFILISELFNEDSGSVIRLAYSLKR